MKRTAVKFRPSFMIGHAGHDAFQRILFWGRCSRLPLFLFERLPTWQRVAYDPSVRSHVHELQDRPPHDPVPFGSVLQFATVTL